MTRRCIACREPFAARGDWERVCASCFDALDAGALDLDDDERAERARWTIPAFDAQALEDQ